VFLERGRSSSSVKAARSLMQASVSPFAVCLSFWGIGKHLRSLRAVDRSCLTSL